MDKDEFRKVILLTMSLLHFAKKKVKEDGSPEGVLEGIDFSLSLLADIHLNAPVHFLEFSKDEL